MSVTRAIGVVEDPRYGAHRAPPGHPECPERLGAVHEALQERAAELVPVAARPAEDDELLVKVGELRDALTAKATAALPAAKEAEQPGFPFIDIDLSLFGLRDALRVLGIADDLPAE